MKVSCVHHWIIATASGATSRGVCKFCGEAKDFQNFIPQDLSYILIGKDSNYGRATRGEFNRWVGG